MHAYGLEAAQMTSLYDRLQDIHKINGFPLDVDDLPLSHNVRKSIRLWYHVDQGRSTIW